MSIEELSRKCLQSVGNHDSARHDAIFIESRSRHQSLRCSWKNQHWNQFQNPTRIYNYCLSVQKSRSMLCFCQFWGTENGISGARIKDHFSIQTSPHDPQKATSGTKIGPRKVIFGHFINFAYFWVIFPLARTTFFKCKIRAEGALKSKSCQHKLALELNFLSNSKGPGLYFNFWFFTEPYPPCHLGPAEPHLYCQQAQDRPCCKLLVILDAGRDCNVDQPVDPSSPNPHLLPVLHQVAKAPTHF